MVLHWDCLTPQSPSHKLCLLEASTAQPWALAGPTWAVWSSVTSSDLKSPSLAAASIMFVIVLSSSSLQTNSMQLPL